MTDEATRAAFEAYWEDTYGNCAMDERDPAPVNFAWSGYQAATAASAARVEELEAALLDKQVEASAMTVLREIGVKQVTQARREAVEGMPCYRQWNQHGSPVDCAYHERVGSRPRAEPCPRCAALRAMPGEGENDGE